VFKANKRMATYGWPCRTSSPLGRRSRPDRLAYDHSYVRGTVKRDATADSLAYRSASATLRQQDKRIRAWCTLWSSPLRGPNKRLWMRMAWADQRRTVLGGTAGARRAEEAGNVARCRRAIVVSGSPASSLCRLLPWHNVPVAAMAPAGQNEPAGQTVAGSRNF
jgi:hypothetical protein